MSVPGTVGQGTVGQRRPLIECAYRTVKTARGAEASSRFWHSVWCRQFGARHRPGRFV